MVVLGIPFAVSPVFRAVGVAALAAMLLSGCALNPANTAAVRSPDFSGQNAVQQHATLSQLAARYKNNPQDKATFIYYAAALRAAGQPAQAFGQARDVLRQQIETKDFDGDECVGLWIVSAKNGAENAAANLVKHPIGPESGRRCERAGLVERQ